MRAPCLLTITLLGLLSAGCGPVSAPQLPALEVSEPSSTLYTTALRDLNTVLQVYYPPDAPTFYYYVKPILDSTGLSGTGEIPMSITTMVRDAVSQISYKVRYVEQYDASDQIHLQVEQMLKNSAKIQTLGYGYMRPNADFTIAGSISLFDRNLESTSNDAKLMGSVGGGMGQGQLDASAKTSAVFSRLGVSFNVFLENGVSVPGKFGGEVEVWLAKNSKDIGFSIMGAGLGFGAEATAMHGRHQALRMLTEFSVVQIVGRTLNVPYWRVGGQRTIFAEDDNVLRAWEEEYRGYLVQPAQLVAYMQAQCIACGDDSVAVTGGLDAATRAAFDRFADKYGVSDRHYPNFALYKALENNRLLDTGVAAQAWNAYLRYKNGGLVSADEPGTAPVQARPAAIPPTPQFRPQPAPTPREPASDITAPLHDLF